MKNKTLNVWELLFLMDSMPIVRLNVYKEMFVSKQRDEVNF